MKKIPKRIWTASILCLLAAAVIVYLGVTFTSMWQDQPIYPGPGVTEVRMLSDYNPALKGTHGDTEIYVLDSGNPGASILVLGGTHPNEPSGVVAAVTLIENCQPKTGVLYVIPRANHSAFTCTDPQEGAPMFFTIATPGGDRTFRFGSRATNPIDQWPDSDVYVHRTSGQTLSGSETRNLNRAYPGSNTGTFTERVTYGLTEFIKENDVKITVDLHEASPEYPTINAIVAHQDAMELASWAAMDMQLEGMKISIEASPTNLHGLSHRELGDFTDTMATLMETANASQGRLRGRTSADLVVTGVDHYYYLAGQYGALYVDFPETGIPIDERVARHICGIEQLCSAYNELGNELSIDLGDLPSYREIVATGIGAYLDPTD
ncbi:MAG: succinylglutamate desuccinylase/aspartoacylase family protein [Clostridia bacterium]|nr:succinylglutamate desuccinylase/aspartoacylase family protein [Clostridia bacterium]